MPMREEFVTTDDQWERARRLKEAGVEIKVTRILLKPEEIGKDGPSKKTYESALHVA